MVSAFKKGDEESMNVEKMQLQGQLAEAKRNFAILKQKQPVS